MDLRGEYRIPAPQEQVWNALNDPEVLRQSIPGCESLDKVEETVYRAVALVKVGPVKARFTGSIELSDLNPPHSYTITGQGKGGAAGFAKGEARVTLVSDGRETILTYTVKANVGGKLAQIGQRLIDLTARKMADDFFTNFVRTVSSAALDTGTEIDLAPRDQASATPIRTGYGNVWAVATAVLVALIIVLFLIVRS
ncbi:MAG: carbon monoxide dehydrogenase [Alphaproteobacteria bacterium]|nr:MAG: carbon monoxide dehydrogenase [Alphaproteobacteria bacterium]